MLGAKKKAIFVVILIVSTANNAFSHSGRTNSAGCHNNTKTGDYHCHNTESTGSGSTGGGSIDSTQILKVLAVGTLLYLLRNSVSKCQERTYTNECKNNLNITPKIENEDEIEVKIEYRY